MMGAPNARVCQSIRRKLLRWYDCHGRDLPWRRRSDDGYAQWVAEIMLQQTQVDTVIPYFERFMRRFPDVHALAAATDDQLLQQWQGLGYYRRAANLHKTAKLVASNGGAFPDTVKELSGLPGIGRYTAAAIASIAFNRRAAAVDGNIARVLARLFGVRDDLSQPATTQRIWELAEALLPNRRCGDFNQALMDLGATLCTPSRPRCHGCPVRSKCKADQLGLTGSIPLRSRRSAVSEVRSVALVVCCGDALLLMKRPTGGLWSGLWEFPNRSYGDGDGLDSVIRAMLAALGLQRGRRFRSCGHVTHRLTHRRMLFDVVAMAIPRRSLCSTDSVSRWVARASLTSIPMSTASRKIVKLVENDWASRKAAI